MDNKNEFDLNAAIIPGRAAAGLEIGQTVAKIIAGIHPIAVIPLHDGTKLCFEYVTIWVKNNVIFQISVTGAYQGAINETIRIGSTIRDVQNTLGEVMEDEYDNLIVPILDGWCFETEQWGESRKLEDNLNVRITEIFVYPSRAT